MEIKIERKARIEGGIGEEPAQGGLRVIGEADLETDQIAGNVTVAMFSVDEVIRFAALPEDVERAGEIVRALRRRVGDDRDLCAEHGYYPAKAPHYDCPTCGKNAKVAKLEPAKVDAPPAL